MVRGIEAFKGRFDHAANKIRSHVPAELRTGRFLDVGCGIGNGVAAALSCGASLAVGIDRSFAEFQHNFDLESFPSACKELGLDPTHALLIEADIFSLNLGGGGFDYALMLDSAEHVPDPAKFFQWIYKQLKPGGCFVMDTCPLFYSMQGAHLWHWFGDEPWAHLKPDFDEKCKERKVDAWSLQRYDELNRCTHDQLRNWFTQTGFTITSERRGTPNEETERLFLQHSDGIDFTKIPKNWLFENWILLVGRKPI